MIACRTAAQQEASLNGVGKAKPGWAMAKQRPLVSRWISATGDYIPINGRVLSALHLELTRA